MNPYELERLAAERQSEYVREAQHGALATRPHGSPRLAAAWALRTLADWLDGGDAAPNRLGTACS